MQICKEKLLTKQMGKLPLLLIHIAEHENIHAQTYPLSILKDQILKSSQKGSSGVLQKCAEAEYKPKCILGKSKKESN